MSKYYNKTAYKIIPHKIKIIQSLNYIVTLLIHWLTVFFNRKKSNQDFV